MSEKLSERTPEEIKAFAVNNLEAAVSLFSLEDPDRWPPLMFWIINHLLDFLNNIPVSAIQPERVNAETHVLTAFPTVLSEKTPFEIKSNLTHRFLPALQEHIEDALREYELKKVSVEGIDSAACVKLLAGIMVNCDNWS